MFSGERSKRIIEGVAITVAPAIAFVALGGCSAESRTDTTQPKVKVERAIIDDAAEDGVLKDTAGRELNSIYDTTQVINSDINGRDSSRDCVIRGISKLNSPDDFGKDSLGFPYVKATSIKIPTDC